MKSQLDDMHLDWCEITDFQLATLLWPSFSQEQTKLLLGDLNLQNFKPVENLQNGEIVLRDAQNDIVIDELIYMRMSAFMCRMHNITKKVEKAANAFTKKILIDEDRQNIARNKDKPYKSFLLPILSAVKVRQRYSLDYVRSMHVNELMYELNRLDIIRQSDALLQGSYSGMIDTSKINKSAFDWTRPIEIEKPKGLSLG